MSRFLSSELFFDPRRAGCRLLAGWVLAAAATAAGTALAADEHDSGSKRAVAMKEATEKAAAKPPEKPSEKAPEKSSDQPAAKPESLSEQVRQVLESSRFEQATPPQPRRRGRKAEPAPPPPTVVVNISKRGTPTATLASEQVLVKGNAPPADPLASRQYLHARAIALSGRPPTGDMPGAPPMPVAVAARGAAGHGTVPGMAAGPMHWDYDGEAGPQAWAKLDPANTTCATGRRQAPIHIEDSFTLQGPAEPLQFDYQASGGSVVNNGHTLQVDLDGENTLTVRGERYKLVQFHFHHPAEEKINYKGFAMVAHLVHRNAAGQLAVVAVLLDPGAANAFIDKVWTYVPLDVGDRVRIPAGMLDVRTLLPQDQRYYQFMGSLTTPPCSEGVLWMVLKNPVPLSREQLKLFTQLFPNNARPTQPLNGRVVREQQ